jgi:tetratricopeptide (TPR) repeat protein
MNLGDFAGAQLGFRQSLAILKKALGAEDRYVSDAEMNLAECLNAEGKYDEAELLYTHAAKVRILTLGDAHSETALSIVGLAGIALDRAMYADAERHFNQALDAWKNSRNPQEADAVPIYHGLAAIHRERGDYREAERYLDKSRSALKNLVQQNHLLAAGDLENLALLRKAQGNREAQSLFETVLAIREHALGNKHPDTARSASNVAMIYYQNGDYANAERLFNDALEVQKALVDSPDLAITLYGLGRLYSDRGWYSEAEVNFKGALDIQTKAIPGAEATADTLAAYAGLLRKTDRPDAASPMEARSRQIRNDLEK